MMVRVTRSAVQVFAVAILLVMQTQILQGEEFNVFSSLLRVRLAHSKSQYEISGKLLTWQGHSQNFLRISIPKIQKMKVSWDEKLKSWRVQDETGFIKIYSEAVLVLNGENLFSGAEALPQKIFFWKSVDTAGIDMVALLDVDQYLRGVIAAEMQPGWPMEALKAQAIASRSYAYYQINKWNTRHYHLDATTHDQVYNYLHTNLSEVKKQKVARALNETRTVVLQDKSSQVWKAYFHADCGGSTEDGFFVWGTKGKTGSAKDSSCPLNPRARWQLQMSKAEMGERLLRQSDPADSSEKKLVAISVLETSPSGRAVKLQLNWSDRTEEIYMGEDLRARLGYNRLRSTLFQVHTEGNLVKFSGLGYGHGVGLCQWGARQLALSGLDYKKILLHYYPMAHLSRFVSFHPRGAISAAIQNNTQNNQAL